MTASATMAADPARMTPLYLDGCFAWLHVDPHARATALAPSIGVVLCSATAQEEVCTRHGLMLLADRLAQAGVPTLRFDYRGTGDSIGDAPSVDGMVDDIRHAVDALRQRAGVEGVVLCGMRLGATLAVRAAEGIDGLAGIALLAPVVSGAQFVRDMGVSVKFSPLASLDPVPPPQSDAALNTHGFAWSRTLRDAVRTLDLATMPVPRVPTLVALDRAGRRGGALVAGWRAAGVPVAEHAFDDYPMFMRDPTTHVMPDATFDAVAYWVGALPAVARVAGANRRIAIAPRLALDDAVETPLRLGHDGATLGVLCEPTTRAVEPVAALLLHEGSSHHIGNGRALVVLARRLAARGFVSLRVDLTGMGDSPAPAGARRPFSDPDRLVEVSAAIDALAARAPGGVVASGLCSGAEMAWHASLADARVAGTLLVNMPAFGWDPTAQTSGDPTPTKRTLRSYTRAIRAGGVRRVLRGDVDLAGVAAALARRGASDLAHRLRGLTRREADPARATVHRQLRALAARRVHSWFVFSDDDPGLPEIRAHFRDGDRDVSQFEPARIHVMADADHHFNGSDVRRRYHDLAETAMYAVLKEYRDRSTVGPESRRGAKVS